MDPENPDDKPKEGERYRAFFQDDEPGRVARGWYYHNHQGLQGPFSDQEQAEQDIARLMNSDLWGIPAEDGEQQERKR